MTVPVRAKSSSLCRTIGSTLEEVEALCLQVRALLNADVIAEERFPVELLARECLVNAAIHGNRNAADKPIDLSLSLGRKWIRLQVGDTGPGFSWRNAKRKDLDTSRTSGRGLQLYRMYASRFRFNRSGNRVTLWFERKKRAGKDSSEMAAYAIELKENRGTVKLQGDLTAVTVPDLQAELKLMLNAGTHDVVFDLSNTAMLDSSGMGLLIAAANSLTPKGGTIQVTNVAPDILRLLRSMRLISRLNVSGKA